MFSDLHLYTDILLVLGCAGTALYCFRIQRSLRQLQKLDGGVGQTIQALNEAISASQMASSGLRDELAETVAALDGRHMDLKKRRQEVDDLLDAMDGQMAMQFRRCQEARQLTEKALTPLVRKAEMEIQALTKALELKAQMERLAEERRAPPAPSPAKDPLDELWAELESGSERERERADLLRDEDNRPYNPFLRAVGG
ncbi:MAG: hypothetical protein AAF830_16895 [Pseudomonadota bacterium]